MNFGAQEAERILLERARIAGIAADRERDERVINTEQVRFFEAMSEYVETGAKSFNERLLLSREVAITFRSVPGLIELGKRSDPYVAVKLTHNDAQRCVVIHAETMERYSVGNKTMKWYFDVRGGELRLDGNTVIECGGAILSLVTQFCR